MFSSINFNSEVQIMSTSSPLVLDLCSDKISEYKFTQLTPLIKNSKTLEGREPVTWFGPGPRSNLLRL